MNLSLPNDREFAWKDGTLWCENVPLKDLAARFGTPLYVYSKRAIVTAFQSYQKPLEPYKHLMCFAVKANSNLSIIRLLGELGAGFDIVSEGELRRIQAAGCDTSKVIFSGVAKTHHEIEAALDANIKCFNIESPAELDRVIAVAQKKGKKARVSFRVNPDVDAKTHPYISTGLKKNKFGIAYDQAVELYLKASRSPELEVVGIDCHIGSQITDTAPFVDACEKLCTLLDKLRLNGIELQHIDFGGGLGIQYSTEAVPSPTVLVAALRRVLVKRGYGDKEMIFEAGRSLVGNSGALLMTFQYMKHGCVVAATGSSCGITWLMGGTYEQVAYAVQNMIANLTGMICDGAKPSCALKVTTGVSTAVLSAIMAMENRCVTSVEGIIDEDVDQSIRNLTKIGSKGMNETDKLVLEIMTSK